VTPLVVDASVVARWFLPEPDGQGARALLADRQWFVAPDLLFPELIRLVQRQVRYGRLRAAQGRRLIADLEHVAVETVPCRALATDAWALSAPGRTVQHSTYLALAARLRTQVCTLDDQLIRSVAATPALETLVRDIREAREVTALTDPRACR
jgi:predicted nucleic acid-binding protein